MLPKIYSGSVSVTKKKSKVGHSEKSIFGLKMHFFVTDITPVLVIIPLIISIVCKISIFYILLYI